LGIPGGMAIGVAAAEAAAGPVAGAWPYAGRGCGDKGGPSATRRGWVQYVWSMAMGWCGRESHGQASVAMLLVQL